MPLTAPLLQIFLRCRLQSVCRREATVGIGQALVSGFRLRFDVGELSRRPSGQRGKVAWRILADRGYFDVGCCSVGRGCSVLNRFMSWCWPVRRREGEWESEILRGCWRCELHQNGTVGRTRIPSHIGPTREQRTVEILMHSRGCLSRTRAATSNYRQRIGRPCP
jgi:hypothetical protein